MGKFTAEIKNAAGPAAEKVSVGVTSSQQQPPPSIANALSNATGARNTPKPAAAAPRAAADGIPDGDNAPGVQTKARRCLIDDVRQLDLFDDDELLMMS